LLRLWIIVTEGRNVRIIFPKVRAQCSNVCEKFSRIPMVQIADRRSQHYNIPRRKTALQDQFFHCCGKRSSSCRAATHGVSLSRVALLSLAPRRLSLAIPLFFAPHASAHKTGCHRILARTWAWRRIPVGVLTFAIVRFRTKSGFWLGVDLIFLFGHRFLLMVAKPFGPAGRRAARPIVPNLPNLMGQHRFSTQEDEANFLFKRSESFFRIIRRTSDIGRRLAQPVELGSRL